jgi:hypothetical protein
MGAVTTRESLLTFAMHGLQVNQTQVEESGSGRRRGLVAMMALSIIVGYCVCGVSSLWCYYRFSTPISPGNQAVKINTNGLIALPRDDIQKPLDAFASGRFPPRGYNPWLHMGAGLGVTAALQALALRFSAWPFMPVGYLISSTWYAQLGWFSVLLGWGAKLVILRLGGARLYQRAKPFFIGLIFGEGLAAAFWMVVALVLAANHRGYEVIDFLLPH